MSFFAKIRERAWNSHYFPTPHFFAKYPTMLTPEEMRLLAWLAATTDVEGSILDLGSFLGGAAISFGYGAEFAKRKATIHSYDRFEIDEKHKFLYLYRKGHGYFEGTDALPLFRTLTARYADSIAPHKGDVRSQTCPDEPIAIAFVDISKSWELNDHLLKQFFTRLKAGCVIVQQDFLYYANPWLYSTMRKLEPCIEFLSYAQDYSVVYGVTRDVTEADIRPCLAENTTPAEVREAIVATKRLFPDLRQREMIDAVLASHDAHPNAKNAWSITNARKLPVRVLEG